MIKIKQILPYLIFVLSFLVSLSVIVLSRQLTQKKTISPQKGYACNTEFCDPCDRSCVIKRCINCACQEYFCEVCGDCWGMATCTNDRDCDCPIPTNAPTQPPAPTNTPAPTQTPAPTNTPAPTQTPIISPTPSLTLTPSITTVNTPTLTPINTPTSTPKLTATVNPPPLGCATKNCDNVTNPCSSGLICIQAVDGANYCSLPDFQNACRQNPTYINCCTSPGVVNTSTPTYLAQVTHTPPPLQTNTPIVPTIPQAGGGMVWIFIPLLIVLIGLLF